MNLKTGTIIKELRGEHHITQDTLAAAIGVTPQAISRWESENGYPDIETLPALADFFSVSIDELLGYKRSEREEALWQTKKEMNRLSEIGTIEDRLIFARNAHARFPADHEIKENLAVCIYHIWDENRDPALFAEMEALCTAVVAECKDEDTRYDAINLLINIYGETGQTEKAMNAVNLLTPMKYCREFAKSSGIGDGKTELYIQDEIDKLTDCLGIAIRNYTIADELPNGSDTWERKIEMLDISSALYRLIYGDNLMFYHTRLSWNEWLKSTFQMSLGKTEDALVSLEAMAFHTVAYDKSYQNDHGKHYTSILTNQLIYPEPSKDFHELTEHSQCWYMLDRLQHTRYDSVRDNPRFIAVVEALKQYER